MADIKIRKEDQEQSAEERETFGPLALWRKLFHVSLGTMAIAQEEVEKLIQALIEQGELAEKEGKRLVDKLATKQREQVRHTQDRGETVVEELLAKLQIPSQSRIASLEARIAELSAKLDQFQPINEEETTQGEEQA